MVTEDQVWQALKTVIDPELHIDIVSLGLVYKVSISSKQTPDGERPMVHILMTLTTPGCPLAGMFDTMVKDALRSLEGIDVDEDVYIELTFDPPWIVDMMSSEARAELGFN